MATTFKVPKTLGLCADRLYELDEARGKINKQLETLREEERAIEEHLIQNLPKDDARGIMGKLARATIKLKQVATVKDWEALYKHVLKKKDFSFFQRRVSDAAVRERWDAGEKVPGVEPFTVVKVSINKIKE